MNGSPRLQVASHPEGHIAQEGGAPISSDQCGMRLDQVQVLHDGLPLELRGDFQARLNNVTFVGNHGNPGCFPLDLMRAMMDHPTLLEHIVDLLSSVNDVRAAVAESANDAMEGMKGELALA